MSDTKKEPSPLIERFETMTKAQLLEFINQIFQHTTVGCFLDSNQIDRAYHYAIYHSMIKKSNHGMDLAERSMTEARLMAAETDDRAERLQCHCDYLNASKQWDRAFGVAEKADRYFKRYIMKEANRAS